MALGDYYWHDWHSDPFQMETAEANVVVGHHGSVRSSSCFVGSVCSLDHEVDSRIRVYWHRHSGFSSDPLDSSCCREVHGRTKGQARTGLIVSYDCSGSGDFQTTGLCPYSAAERIRQPIAVSVAIDSQGTVTGKPHVSGIYTDWL